ncbi:MAG: tRNA pseudouridine(13) synthase TruD [Chromatiales bacterium]|nr:tRNA pseudouridine(13) synthase TruD [Chromatiales bacterium]
MKESCVDSLPRAFGGPKGSGVIRRELADFIVEEISSVEPSGEGEHVLLHIEKAGANTDWVAKQLARHADVPNKDVSFAGLKDRYAVTRQWFSVRLAGRDEPDWSALNSDEVQVLAAERHNRKLKRGALKGNKFVIRIRELDGERQRMAEILEQIEAEGVPNYFGEQRFGYQDRNIESARALFAGELKRVPRAKRSFYLSAARSLLFNQLLAERVRAGNWNRIIAGERCLLAGSRSSFIAEELDDELHCRCRERDIHPSAPLWGRGKPDVDGAALAFETEVLNGHQEWMAGLEKFGLEKERRSLRADVSELNWEWGDELLTLSFTLPKGSFATALLRELLDYREDERG